MSPDVVTRVCLKNKLKKEVNVFVRMVIHFNGLDFDIHEAAKQLPPDELFKMLGGVTNWLAKQYIESNPDDETSPEYLKMFIHQNLLQNELEDETVEKMEKYISHINKQDSYWHIYPGTEYIETSLAAATETMKQIGRGDDRADLFMEKIQHKGNLVLIGHG